GRPPPVGGAPAPRGDPPPPQHPKPVPRAGRLQQEKHPAPRRLHLPVLQPARREAHRGSRRAALAGRPDHLDQRGGGLPPLQSLQGEPDVGGGSIAAHSRARAPPVPLLRASHAASPRDELPRLVAEVSGRGSDQPLSKPFRLSSEFEPAGDQPRAIDRLSELLAEGHPHTVLLGITGSGKTFSL